MKTKSFYHIFTTMCLVLVSSCANETVLESDWVPSMRPRSLGLSTEGVSVPSNGGVAKLSVEAQNASWKFAGENPAWASIAPVSGSGTQNVEVTAKANPDATSGRSVIYLLQSVDEGMDVSRPLTVSQDAPPYSVKAMSKEYVRPASGGPFVVGVVANAPWKVTSDQPWLKVQSVTREAVNAFVDENTTSPTADRIAHLTLTCGNATEVVIISQQPPHITADNAEQKFGPDGGIKKINVTSDVAWTADCSQPWVTLTPQSAAAGTTTMTVSVAPSGESVERTARVYVKIGSTQMYSIPIRQEANLKLDVTPSSIPSLPAMGEGSYSLTLNTRLAWKTTLKESNWAHVTPSSGQGNAVIKLTVDANNNTSARNNVLTVASSTGTPSVTFPFTQKGRTLELSTSIASVPSKGGDSSPITVTADGLYKVDRTSGDWFSVTQTGNTFTLKADEWTGNARREGEVTVSLSGLLGGQKCERRLRVIQDSEGSIVATGFDSDKDWNFETISIYAVGFGEDIHWELK